MAVLGFVEAGYESVRETFVSMCEQGIETGGAVSVWADGREVVNLSGGWADRGHRQQWRSDTLVHTYSTSKPFASLAALAAVAQGALELDEPVSRYWTEYGTKGKACTTLRDILTHRAGLPGFPRGADQMDLLDDCGLRRLLAEAEPESVPGSVLAEHAVTYGHLIDGVLRAATGRTMGEIYAEDVRPALGMDGWFGVPVDELPRVAELEYALPGGAEQFVREVCPSYERVLEYPRGSVELDRINSAEFRTSVFGAINLCASAQALAKFYSTLTREDGPVRKLLGQSLHDEYLASQTCGFDETVGLTVNWTLGPLRTNDFIGLGGLGGSAAWWSLRHDHGVSYVTRRLHDHSRAAQIASALGDNISMEFSGCEEGGS